MADATRDEAIQWCIDNRVDFTQPKFPPPDGWMWADTDVPAKVLTAIFTNTEDEDIESVDVFFKVAAQAHAIPDDEWVTQFAARLDKCPVCDSDTGIKLPREGAAYCEDCGWPHEDFAEL